MRRSGLFVLSAAALALSISGAVAAEAESCRTVRLADGGWTDNTAQNALAEVVLRGLGYDVEATVLAVPVILQGLENGQVDIWLDNWMPSQTTEVTPFLEKGTVADLGINLDGAGYGPVVPGYVAEAGVRGLEDLAGHGEQFDRKFYGIEPGNDGNRIVQGKIDDPANGLAEWTLVESSEQGMLAQVDKMVAKDEWVAFLAWTPHPVMGKMDLHYLTGFEADGFGPAQIHTLTRAGYAEACPNVGAFLRNLKFSLELEGGVMQAILDGEDAVAAARAALTASPDTFAPWLAGVQTVDGADGLPAVRGSLGL